MRRETMLAHTLVELADSLVADFDVVDLLTLLADRCVDTFDVAAAGIMLAGPDGVLRVVASSSEEMRVLELLEEQTVEGPCLDCYRTGAAVTNQQLATALERWPRFAPEALDAGFTSVQAQPMRLRDSVIGALNLFHADQMGLSEDATALAQAFADVATIAILQHRASRDAEVVVEQLREALQSRILIEQAKGVTAERLGLDMSEAFARLRGHARHNNLRLTDVATAVIDGTLDASALAAASKP
jgi:GAF domain-containing protein